MVILFQQYILKIYIFSKFSVGGLCDWGIFLVISLEFQGNKASTVFYDTALQKRSLQGRWDRQRQRQKGSHFLGYVGN